MSESAAATPASSQRARQRQETRERIFEAAVEEFRRVGFQEAQIPRIAAAAGVVRGTFYFHFPSKDHVLEELASRFHAQIADAMQQVRRSASTFGQMLSGLADAIGQVDETLAEADLIQDVVTAQVRAGFGGAPTEGPSLAIRDELCSQIEEAVERGELRGDLEPEPVARAILCGLFGIMASPRSPDLHRRGELELLVKLLMGGMRG